MSRGEGRTKTVANWDQLGTLFYAFDAAVQVQGGNYLEVLTILSPH